MAKIATTFLLLISLVAFSGCRCSSCKNNWFNPLAGFGSPRINPPATYSYQVPQTGQATPYYNSNSTATLPVGNMPGIQNGVPAQPAGSQQNLNQNWRPTGNKTTAINPYQYNPPSGYPTNYTTLASSTATIRSTDYRTTATDERFDRTRMPVSDASNIAAPSRFVPQGNWQLAQNQPIQIQGQVQYQGQPTLYSPNGVLAQSSTAAPYANNGYPNGNYAYNGYANNYQNGLPTINGWRSQSQMNR
jgi:hypothetical protein